MESARENAPGAGAGRDAVRVDVAVNIFAKPFQTALSLLSLLRCSGARVGVIWLQFEPYGSRYDLVSPYSVARYLRARLGEERCRIFQPQHWLALTPLDMGRLGEPDYRLAIRYQYAFEHSQARHLLLLHNDVFVLNDLVGHLLARQEGAAAVGQLGQCWNCPAHDATVARDVMACAPCSPAAYRDFRPDYGRLRRLYALARERGLPVRPYDQGFTGIFDKQPWPLPECRVNEWACLLDLDQVRRLCLPFGDVLPPGAFQQCGGLRLDTGVAFFRGLHANGLFARHADLSRHLRHWVGTGKKTARRYCLAEENALGILKKHFPEYCAWLCETEGMRDLRCGARA